MLKMIFSLALSIFLLPILTVLGSQFWNDVDTLHNELIASQDLPTHQTTTTEAQLAEPTPPAPQHSLLPNQLDEKYSKRWELLKRKAYEKTITLSANEVDIFKQTLIIDESYPQNLSLSEIEDKLLASGRLHEWFDIDTYDFTIYGKYWAKVCVYFWNKPLVDQQRYVCVIYPSYGIHSKRKLNIRHMKQHFDLLCCRCHLYEKSYKINVTAPETFLIHKHNENEYFVFDQDETMENRYTLSIKEFKGGITLPEPLDEEQSKYRSTITKIIEKQVTLNPYHLYYFNQALIIDKTYSNNISTIEIAEKLLQFKSVYEWPNLHKYDVDSYSKYWAKVCVYFWGKQLDSTHRQACILSPSLRNKKRKLFLPGRVLYFDLLCCKCHSYATNYKKPISAPETFLIHQRGKNEFIIFVQRATENTTYTLIIKDFKGGIILPDPDEYNY